MTTWLVTGGAGYIGAHVVRALAGRGLRRRRARRPVERAPARSSPDDVPFVDGSVVDRPPCARALARARRRPASSTWPAYKYAGVSVERPLHTYDAERRGHRQRCSRRCVDAGVDQLVFSSVAAVYGTPDVDLVTEATPTAPESPYGETKLVGEWLLARRRPRRRAACGTRRCATSTSSARARPTSTTPARTTCSRWCSRR